MEPMEQGTTTTVVVDEQDETVKKLRPFRGFFWGLLIGIGLAGVLVFSATITLSILAVIACIVVGLFVGVVWGVLGPAKKPKGPPPSTRVVVQQVPASRFDDFDPPSAPAEPATDGDTGEAPAPADTPAETSDGAPAGDAGSDGPTEEQRSD